MKKVLYLAVLSCFSATLAIAAEENKVGVEVTKASPAVLSATWAYQPVVVPAIPTVQQKKWVRTPIDAFVLAQLEANGLKPSSDAARAVFIRRATLDALGIVPTPEEVKAFVNDRSVDAYEKLVDRLLASPRYGERQGRRWLDLARYSDSAGFTNDETRPNAWRYRDYVIKAFNDDKAYNQFIKEQVAGDELWPGKEEALVATGFLRYYPDDSNSRDLVQRKYLTTTDMVDTLGAVVLGQSVDCARCHNHKTDKVSQNEYFQLQAFFANANADDNIPVKNKGEVEAKYEKEWAAYQEASKKARADLDDFVKPYLTDAEKYNKQRFFDDTQASLFKTKDKWDAHDRWINQRYENNLYTGNGVAGRAGLVGGYLTYLSESAENKEKKAEFKALSDRYTKLTEALRKFNDLRPAAGSNHISAITELGHADAPPTHVRFTGIHDKYQDVVQPGIPALFNPTKEKIEIKPTETSSGRRSALAGWLVSPNNPLTARVYVNRIWEQYFGKGIVGTVSDFGRAGERPTNPELLNYLANNFVQEGWSVKKIHRQILLSSVYRQSSDFREDAYKVDPQNKLLAVFPRQRLEAEQIRDSLLAVSGLLEEKLGGPAVFPPIPSILTAGGRNLWTVSKDAKDHNRRSVYVFNRRSVPYPMLDVFDGASPQATHAKRDVTTTPLQALTLVNNDLVYKWSQNLAGRVIREVGSNEAAQFERLYQILYARSPDKVEKETLASYLNRHEKVLKEQLSTGKLAINVPAGLKEVLNSDPLRLAAFVDLAHTLVNANEFTYRY